MTPEFIRRQPLCAPLAGWFSGGVPVLADLNRFATAANVVTGAGQSLRFVRPDDSDLDYERRALVRGEVVTRNENWHDLFGALMWLSFPAAKAAMNRRHCREISAIGGRRGAVRDALTQLDECGAVVLTTDASLWDDIAQHRWRRAFVERREEVRGNMIFLICGHGIFDSLREPFPGLCAKAVAFHVDSLPTAVAEQLERADELLAAFIEQSDDLHPRQLQPLPILGIPGVIGDSENPAYYDDPAQFRPARPGIRATIFPGSSLDSRCGSNPVEESPGPSEQDAG